MSEENPYLVNPRWLLAEQVAGQARRRYPADILAIGVYGPLAHGDDDETSDVNLVAVTYRPGMGPRPATRRLDGVLVDLAPVGADDYLAQARTLSASWPLVADRYVSTKPLHDPTGWLPALRDAHLGRLASARPAEFTSLARQAWCRGFAAHTRAVWLAQWYQIDAALLMLGAARLAAATVVGLFTRTYFRTDADAVIRTGLAGADMTELGTVLRDQATELAARGRPVDGTVADLFGD
ncbi:nucleotidyltransferase domain-containing protein [Plantactinospora soyae]|uniref:Nucleotidyltransferase domain-containing protein n=1 Tax=Plantactinospora soyae TaxID=1544732 RepID=A0A927M6H4_9ACTN|nr:nucleotidyltransferase domain-containing protein [Plantactinospora soyae]MBE1487902.1 hypothetical protein [Plantactinospora soyae]